MNRCELVGYNNKKMKIYFKFPLKDDMMEQEMMNRINENTIQLPLIKLHKPTKQGSGGLMKYL